MTLQDAALLDYPQAFWTREYLWPRGDRKRIFLAHAVDDVGAAMFGPGWTGREPAEGVEFDVEDLLDAQGALPMKKVLERRRVRRPKSSSSGTIALTMDAEGHYHHAPDWHVVAFKQQQHRQRRIKHAQAAYDSYMRLTQVCNWIAEVGVNEDVQTYGRIADGTETFLLPGSIWDVEPVWDNRVAACSFGHASIHRGRAAHHPTYLFLDREGLARCIGKLPFAPHRDVDPPEQANGVWLSPFMEVLIETVKVCELGPTPDQHPDVDWIGDRMREIADARGLSRDIFSPSLIKAATTLIRHPDAKDGPKVWRSKLRAAEGSNPKN